MSIIMNSCLCSKYAAVTMSWSVKPT
jgi:hypothetical protein